MNWFLIQFKKIQSDGTSHFWLTVSQVFLYGPGRWHSTNQMLIFNLVPLQMADSATQGQPQGFELLKQHTLTHKIYIALWPTYLFTLLCCRWQTHPPRISHGVLRCWSSIPSHTRLMWRSGLLASSLCSLLLHTLFQCLGKFELVYNINFVDFLLAVI